MSIHLLESKNILPSDPSKMTEEKQGKIVQLLQLLHPFVMSGLRDEHVPCLTAKEFKKFALEDTRFLTQCLYALGADQSSLDHINSKCPHWQSQVLSSVCASEILARSCRTKPGYFQHFFGDQLCVNHSVS
jgi:hypothetical protein